MIKHFTTIPFMAFSLMLAIPAQSQTKLRYRVNIPPTARVQKKIKVDNCFDTIRTGNTVKSEYTLTNKKVTYTITHEEERKTDTALEIEKDISIDMYPDAAGEANITVDENDKSILHINYWLNARNTVPAGKTIVVNNMEAGCDGAYSKKSTFKYYLIRDSTFYLERINIEDLPSVKKKQWYKTTDLIIEVIDSGKVEYYLVNHYDRSADYQLKLQNREYFSGRSKSIEYGPIIIPVKYRFERKKNGTVAKDEFQSDLNIGIYGGYNFGKYGARCEGGTITELPPISLSLGGFLNISTTTIDSAATSLSDKSFATDEKASIGIFSPGIGAMLSLHYLQIGVFMGIDFGMGNSSTKWNFNNQPWAGFGLAYNVSSFWKK